MPRLDYALLAFELSLESVEKLILLQEDIEGPIQALGGRAKWVAPTLIQVPLKYFGAIEGALWGRIGESIAHVSSSLVPFKVSMKGLKAHPSPRIPRLLHTRLGFGSDLAEGLHKVLELHLERLGIDADPRPFLPGAVVGHVATGEEPIDLSALVEGYAETEFGESYVRDLVLFRGHLKSGAVGWDVYKRFPLGARPA